MSELSTVVILSGSGAPATTAANVYFKLLLPHFRVLLVEERNLTTTKIIRVLWRRLRKAGLVAVIDLLLLRLWFLLRNTTGVFREYVPSLRCDDINAAEVVELIKRERPAWVITNACSIVRERLLQEMQVPILNVHNGVTPRYRGTGNFWAVREGNQALLGVTVHRLDRSIDAGERISVAPLNMQDQRCATLEGMDIVAFEEGARMVCAYMLEGHGGIPPNFSYIPDRYYSYPGLSDWLAAKRTLALWRNNQTRGEEVWRSSFSQYAVDTSKNPYQRMHWGCSETVAVRDTKILGILKSRLQLGTRMLDIGGGDGRLAAFLPSLGSYVCADYTRSFLREMPLTNAPKTWAVQCDARALPFPADSFDAATAVGLFQHITEAQKVADEVRTVVRSGGLIVVNTLRQFSRLELAVILAASLFSPSKRRLVLAILRRDYFSSASIEGTLVARRYDHRELLQLFGAARIECTAYYNGVFGTSLFSREITLALPCRK